MRFSVLSLAALATFAAAPAMAAGSASVFLNGGQFLQSGSVTNTSAPGTDLVGVRYSLGTQAAGIAIWELNSSTGAHQDFLTGNWYSTELWSGLSFGSGSTFNFGGLDIDLITSMTPPTVTGATIDNAGTSLANATVTAYFSDGSFGSVNLNQTGWTVSQELRIAAVPEPETYALMALGLAGVGLMVSRRRRAA